LLGVRRYRGPLPWGRSDQADPFEVRNSLQHGGKRMNPRLIGLSLATVLVIAAAGTSLAGSAQSAYVTTDTNCAAPIDLQVNHIPSLADANVWLKRVTEADIEEDGIFLTWTLWQGGVQVGSGTFEYLCTTTDGKYSLADPGFFDSVNNPDGGTYTVKVDWNDGTNYSGDSFSIP
jgi:hypothetical protein